MQTNENGFVAGRKARKLQVAKSKDLQEMAAVLEAEGRESRAKAHELNQAGIALLHSILAEESQTIEDIYKRGEDDAPSDLVTKGEELPRFENWGSMDEETEELKSLRSITYKN